MRIWPSSSEIAIAVRSLILAFGLFFVFWLPLKFGVTMQNPVAVSYRMHGGSIDTATLNRYDQAKELAFYFSLGAALFLSQAAIGRAAVLERSDQNAEPDDAVEESERQLDG